MVTNQLSTLFSLAVFSVAMTLNSASTMAEPINLKISHQFPGGTIDSGDFRDRLCQKFTTILYFLYTNLLISLSIQDSY